MTGASAAKAAGGLVALAAGALTWSLVEARWYTLREATVPLLPAGHDPLRILHLSDLHLTPSQDRKVAWVRELASLDPHLVVDTGDNWADLESFGPLAHALEPLLERPGVFVMGSNDYVAPQPKNPARYLLPDARTAPPRPPRAMPWRELIRLFRSAGWLDLDNRRGVLDLDGRRVSFVGTDDAHLDRDRFPAAGGPDDARTTPRSPSAASSAAASGVSSDGLSVDLHVGVTHAPYRRVLDAMLADDADLVLAGHTHGGQLAVPGWGALVTNCDLDPSRAKGLHGWPGPRPDAPGGADSTWLHVSAGLGTSPYTPVRFACRPEATLLTLTPA
ncbi:metallophosphoesterase [Cellulomonas persica]|uniref:Metallophosphoesterase n=1 Tax=Cellulomonas persica TaxID=76861 RepID=A0A510UV92_9CELL|nr:metallophosphoesterase [Cellulomonas persica]GEK18426.1 metallophosphoesterase [Cellulomonas persica]